MPKITVGGGASHADEIVEVAVVPRASGPEVPSGDGTGEALPVEAGDDSEAVVDDEPAEVAEEPAPKARARRRAGAATVEGS
jgi:hypothetical protein